MTCEEFSNAFDVLLASYKYSPEFGNDFSSVDLTFDEYEKSVFLTKAQEEILLAYYTGNTGDNTYEQTEEVRRYLTNLNIETLIESSSNDTFSGYDRLKFDLPQNVWFITYESLKLDNNEKLIIPVSRDVLYKTIQNPFKFNVNRCLRIDDSFETVYIIGKNIKEGSYFLNYLAFPSPIILTDLDNISINRINSKTECVLHEGLHNRILDRAVALAIASKTIIQK